MSETGGGVEREREGDKGERGRGEGGVLRHETTKAVIFVCTSSIVNGNRWVHEHVHGALYVWHAHRHYLATTVLPTKRFFSSFFFLFFDFLFDGFSFVSVWFGCSQTRKTIS